MSRSSKELIAKMRVGVDEIDNILRDNSLKAPVQIADVEAFCWAMVDLAVRLQKAVREELSDLEGDDA